MKNISLKGLLFAIFGAVSWGASGVVSEFLFKGGTDPHVLSVYRMFFAGIIFLMWAYIMPPKKNKKPLRVLLKTKNDLLSLILFSVLGMLLTQYGYLLAIAYSDAGTATMICATDPIFIMIAVCVLNKKSPHAQEVLALILAILGVFLLATKGDISTLNININALLWGLSSAFGMIFYTLTPKNIIMHYGSTAVMGYALILASLILAVYIKIWSSGFPFSFQEFLCLMIIVCIGTVGAFYMFINGVILIGAIRASMVGVLEPLSAAFFSFLFLGTSFTMIDIIAFLCILSTIFIIRKI